MTISLARAKEICTKSELELVRSSSTRNIGALDEKELKAAIRRVRTLRDKWRDKSHAQERTTKAMSPQEIGEANARSAEKSTLFNEALGRFESRLAKLGGQSEKATPRATKKVAPKVDHRADRATVRSGLNAKMDKLNATGPKKTSTKKTATKNVAAEGKATPTKQKPKAVKKADAKKQALVARRKARMIKADTNAVKPVAEQASPKSTKRPATKSPRNLAAKTSAKASAVVRGGTTRVQGHISAQGRRNQARRNAK
ncbi:hypothetical protein SH449x_002996 [Pirellulaceae bacterium SH449]